MLPYPYCSLRFDYISHCNYISLSFSCDRLADKTDGIVGFTLSTSLIVVFGEIIPQALCSRYALEIGARTIWIVWPLMFLLAIIAYPISWILDKVLGEELGTIYSNKELSKLVDITAKYRPNTMDKSIASMLKGALQLNTKRVSDIYTRMDDVFYLNEHEVLSFEVLTKIFKLGHSRIPVFRQTDDTESKPYCIGLIYAKDLILIDPDDNVPIFKVLETFDHHSTPIDIWKNDNLQTALQLFINTCQHLAFVKEETTASNEVHYVGIVTLEDVIEEILKREVVDEFDDPTNEMFDMSWSRKLRFGSNEKLSRAQSAPQMTRPIPVKIENKAPISDCSLPHTISAPFIICDDEKTNEEQQNNSIKSENVSREHVEKKCQSVDNDLRTSQSEHGHRSDAKIRSIPEIKSYLEHFVPKLSVGTTMFAFFIKPLLIALNAFFIIYQFYAAIFADTLISSLNIDGTTFRKSGINLMITVEFSGLCILFLGAVCSYFKSNYAMSIDFIRCTGSWSIFQSFYFTKPFSLIGYAHKTFTNYYGKQRVDWKSLRDDLKSEILRDDNQPNIHFMKKCLEHLDHLINSTDKPDISMPSKMGMAHSLNSLVNDDGSASLKTPSLYSFIKKSEDNGDFSFYTKPDYDGDFPTFIALLQGGAWFISILLLICCLCLGLLCFVLKLSLFGFIISLPMSQWSIFDQWFVFLLFVNQIWNIVDVDSLKVSTIYQFLFNDSSVEHSKYVSQRTTILDSVIKEQLWRSFGFRGFLLALSMNAEIVQKIIVKKSYDLSVLELIRYKKIMSEKTEAKGHGKSNKLRVFSFKNKAKWFEMTDKKQRQPYHPYVVIRQSMDRYYNNMDATQSKVLLMVRNEQSLNYKEYKLAVAGTEASVLDKSFDDGSTLSFARPQTSLSKRKLMKLQSQRKRSNNKLLTELQPISASMQPDICVDPCIRVVQLKENKLMNDDIIFEWILSNFSNVIKILFVFSAIIGVMFTAISLLFYLPYNHDVDDAGCTDIDDQSLKIISKSWE